MQLNSGPLITYYAADPSATDPEAVPGRVELSQVTVDNWIAKTSNLLTEEFGFGPELAGEASASIELPLHWLHSVWLASVWNLGAYVTTRTASANIVVTDSDRVEAALAHASRRQAVVGCTLGNGLDPLGQDNDGTQRTIPPTAVDYSHDVRMFADSFDSGFTPGPDDIAFESETESFTHGQLAQLATEFLAAHGIRTGGRILLSELPLQPADSWPQVLRQDSKLVAALAMGALIASPLRKGKTPTASLVLCRDLDHAQIAQVAEQERAIPVA